MGNKKELRAESFAKSIFNVGIGTIANLIIGFLTTPIITRLIVPEEYGRLSIFKLYIDIAVMVLCLGLDQTLVRYYYKYQDIKYKRWLQTRCVLLPVVAFTLSASVLIILIRTQIMHFEFEDVLVLFLAGVFFALLHRFAVLNLRLLGSGKKYAIATLLYRLLYVVISLLIIVIGANHTFLPLAWGILGGYFFSFLYGFVNTKKVWMPEFENRFDEINTKQLVRYGLPFILSNSLGTLFSGIDKLSLNAFCDYAAVGIYGSALTLVGLFSIIQSSFNAVWSPVCIKHYEEQPDDSKFYARYHSIISCIMFLCGLLFILFKDLFGFLLGAEYRECAQILPMLTMQPIFVTISEVSQTGILIKKKSHLHIVVTGVACVANLIGNITLISFCGVRGAAISTGLSYILFYCLRDAFGNKYYRIPYDRKRFWLCSIVLLVYAILNTFFDIGAWSIVVFILAIGFIAYCYAHIIQEGIAYIKLKRQ